MLHAYTSGEGRPVVLVHGFTQSAASWDGLAERLRLRHRVVAVDAPGHGRSSGILADLSGGADLMIETVGEPAAWIGYSMGGRFALHAALQHPDAVTRLVLVSTTAGIDDRTERHARRQSDEALAGSIEAEGVEAFLRRWLAQPLFSTLPPEAAALDHRLNNTAAGLASSLRLAGAGTQEPLWEYLHTLDIPVLVIAGELDEKYCALGHRLVESIGPNARFTAIEGAGHACHLERPDGFLAVVEPFLSG